MNVEKIRDEDFPVLRYTTFLNACSASLMAKPVAQAMIEQIEAKVYPNLYRGIRTYQNRREWKEHAGRLLNADPDEFASITNIGHGMNIVATMIDWKKGDNIVTNDMEYPGHGVIWRHLAKRQDIEMRVVKNIQGKVLLSDIEDMMDERTRLISISFVGWANGFKFDLAPLAKLANEYGAYVLVDADQGAGAMDLDVRKTGVHFVVGEGHKWLNAPWGMGFLYVKADLITEFEPLFTRVENFQDSWDWVRKEFVEPPDPVSDRAIDPRLRTYMNLDLYNNGLSKTAERFSQSPHSAEAIAGVLAALKYINNLGIKNIESRILKLTDYLIDGLHEIGVKVTSPLEKVHRSGIVAYQPKGRSASADWKALTALRKANIVVSLRYSGGQGGIRTGVHYFNNEEDIDKLLEVQKKCNV